MIFYLYFFSDLCSFFAVLCATVVNSDTEFSRLLQSLYCPVKRIFCSLSHFEHFAVKFVVYQ